MLMIFVFVRPESEVETPWTCNKSKIRRAKSKDILQKYQGWLWKKIACPHLEYQVCSTKIGYCHLVALLSFIISKLKFESRINFYRCFYFKPIDFFTSNFCFQVFLFKVYRILQLKLLFSNSNFQRRLLFQTRQKTGITLI